MVQLSSFSIRQKITFIVLLIQIHLSEATRQISVMNQDIQSVAQTQIDLSGELKELTSRANDVKGVLDIIGAIATSSQKMGHSADSIHTVSKDSFDVQSMIENSFSLMRVAAQSISRSNSGLQELMSGIQIISTKIDSVNAIASSNTASITEITDVAHGLDSSTASLNEQLQKFKT